MKNSCMFKQDVAKLVDMSRATFTRFLRTRRSELESMGVKPTAKLLPPKAVHYILRELGCE